MYQREVIGFEEAQIAMTTMLKETAADPRPVAIAVVDDRGDLVHFIRQDGARPLNSELAVKKAYTAARMRSDTAAFAERLRSQGRSVAEYGDSNLVSVQGGVCILKPGTETSLGGIGVSGLRADEDEALAKIGLSAMNL